jgi:magnesium-transporting ATPase (P-type)
MVTGDNPLTAINVAKECGIIDTQKITYFGDLIQENTKLE